MYIENKILENKLEDIRESKNNANKDYSKLFRELRAIEAVYGRNHLNYKQKLCATESLNLNRSFIEGEIRGINWVINHGWDSLEIKGKAEEINGHVKEPINWIPDKEKPNKVTDKGLNVKYHGLKIWPCYFKSTWEGNKLFEIRKNDRNYGVGDILILMEYIKESKEYTGKIIIAQITYITAVNQIKDNVVLGIKVLNKVENDA